MAKVPLKLHRDLLKDERYEIAQVWERWEKSERRCDWATYRPSVILGNAAVAIVAKAILLNGLGTYQPFAWEDRDPDKGNYACHALKGYPIFFSKEDGTRYVIQRDGSHVHIGKAMTHPRFPRITVYRMDEGKAGVVSARRVCHQVLTDESEELVLFYNQPPTN